MYPGGVIKSGAGAIGGAGQIQNPYGQLFDKPSSGNFLLEKDDDDRKGFLDAFLEGMQSYNPEKTKTDSDKFLDSMAARRSGSGGSFAQLGDGLSMYTPDNSARENAILQQNQFNAQQAAQAKQNKTKTGMIVTGKHR